ncbi:hypothetical protein ACFL6Y_00360 [Elusimicrobiota bacterium]
MNIVFAIILSLLTPGAGQAYNGKPAKACGFGSAYLILHNLFGPLVFGYAKARDLQWLVIVFSVAMIVLYIYAAWDAVADAVKIRKGEMESFGGWRHGLVAFAILLVLTIAFRVLGVTTALMGVFY